MSITLLITGFGPFDIHERNPSGVIAQAVDGAAIETVQIVGVELRVSWRDAWPVARELAEKHRPQAMLCLGVGNAPHFRTEQLTRNLVGSHPDVDGVFPPILPEQQIIEGGPPELTSTLPLDLWEQPGLAQRSTDAGSYLCNFLFYQVMAQLSEVPHRGFVHVPPFGAVESGLIRQGIQMVESLAHWLRERA